MTATHACTAVPRVCDLHLLCAHHTQAVLGDVFAKISARTRPREAGGSGLWAEPDSPRREISNQPVPTPRPQPPSKPKNEFESTSPRVSLRERSAGEHMCSCPFGGCLPARMLTCPLPADLEQMCARVAHLTCVSSPSRAAGVTPVPHGRFMVDCRTALAAASSQADRGQISREIAERIDRLRTDQREFEVFDDRVSVARACRKGPGAPA